jgi:YidC/Oxa1 family membrane protein insertase
LIFGQTISFALASLYTFFSSVPALAWIGAYGLAIVVVTIGIKLILAPLYHFQLSLSRRAMQDQRKLAPELAVIRKRYKNDPQKQQQETMKLYKEHGVNPLGSLSGCLPALLQFPILTALYYVFLGNATSQKYLAHFLFIPDLNTTPGQHPLIPGLPIPNIIYLIIPLLAALTTFVQSRMIQQPPNPVATEQEQQAQQMTQSMQVMMPLMIMYFAVITPAGLGLYWFISNCVAIIQQYFVTGWGNLLPKDKPSPPSKPPARPNKGPDRSSGDKPRRPRK